ncbi:MAG: type IV secretion system protein [Xanthomonadaceae bacterium]|nr:type IV secretion system protein [Xanthomonadaceae bacterium]
MDYGIISSLADGAVSALDSLLRPMTQSWAVEGGYFVLIYNFLRNEILDFQEGVLLRAGTLISSVALVVMMCWVFFQGLRIITGQSRDSMMGLVINSLRATLIVAAATSFGLGGVEINKVVVEDLQQVITELVTGEDDVTPQEQIDENLLYMHLAMTSIDAVKIVGAEGKIELNEKKQQALMLAGVGTAGPAMTGAAMLLLYEVAMAMFIGFGPIFILCLLFDATKSLFQRWLLYGIGTLFSMAVLSAMVAIATKVVVAVAASFWATAAVGALLQTNFSDGFVGIAVQQGGIGILLTVLLISTPPMAASFFQGTLGSFAHYTAWQGGGNVGQRPGEAGYRGQQPSSNSATGGGNEGGWRTGQQQATSPSTTSYNNPATSGNYGTSPVHTDTVKTAPKSKD